MPNLTEGSPVSPQTRQHLQQVPTDGALERFCNIFNERPIRAARVLCGGYIPRAV